MQNKLERLLRLGKERHQHGNIKEAEFYYKKILKTWPNNADANHLLGLISHQVGDFRNAAQLIRRAIGGNPASASYHCNLGLVLHDLGEFEESATYCRKALDLDPRIAEAHNNLGNALRGSGRFQEAERSYRRALELNPRFADAHSNLGLALKFSGRLGEAERSCLRALELEPSLSAALNNLGNVYQEAGRAEEAERSYRRALELNPSFAKARCNLGIVLLQGGRLPEALEEFRCSAEMKGDFDLPRFFMGVIQDLLEEADRAETQFSRLACHDHRVNFMVDSWKYATTHAEREGLLFTSSFSVIDRCLEHSRIDGLVLEFGVRHGATISHIGGRVDQEVHGFDSFEGLPENWEKNEAGTYSTEGKLPDVPLNVRLHVGVFADTLPGFVARHGGPIRFMNVDCDLYSSTATVFDHLSACIVPGTVILFDEYFMNPNWRNDEFKAFGEAVARCGWEYEYIAFNPVTRQAAVRITELRS
jgi:Flp pilus assembly protein TadD